MGSVGCSVRLFTTIQLNGSDPLLLGGFFLAFLANVSLLLQIVYYGTVVEGKNLLTVFSSDISSGKRIHDHEKQRDHEESGDVEINGVVAYEEEDDDELKNGKVIATKRKKVRD